LVRVAPLATGIVLIALFIGFELKIPAIENLIPGQYGGLSTTGYIGIGFLLGGISSLGAAFSGSRSPSFGSGASGAPTPQDIAAMAAAMGAARPGPGAAGSPAGAGQVACLSCGRINSLDARFCQGCAAPLGSPPAAGAPPPSPPGGAR
jgi:hypothetical protein